MCILLHVNIDIMHAYMKAHVTCTHMTSQTHTHTHTQRHACTHSTNEDGNLALSLSAVIPRLYPCHQLSLKVKSLKFLSFILFRCWTVPGSQAIKHKATSHQHFSPSVPLFRHTLPILLFILSVFNWTFTYRWLPEIHFSLLSIWHIYSTDCILHRNNALQGQTVNCQQLALSMTMLSMIMWEIYKCHSI